jgi:hypothetical protein
MPAAIHHDVRRRRPDFVLVFNAVFPLHRPSGTRYKTSQKLEGWQVQVIIKFSMT